MKRVSKKVLLWENEILRQQLSDAQKIREVIDKENQKLMKEIQEKEEREAYKIMLPTSIYDNKVYNILLEWVQKCKVGGIAIKMDNSKKIISVLTPKPGVMIGPQGKTVEEVENKIHSLSFYKDYKIYIYEITMLISETDKKVSDEEYQKNWVNFINDRFSLFDK